MLWPALHVVDLASTAILLTHRYHEADPVAAVLLAHGGLVAFVAVTVLGVGVGIALAVLGMRWVPRFTLAILAALVLLVMAAVANNTALLLTVRY